MTTIIIQNAWMEMTTFIIRAGEKLFISIVNAECLSGNESVHNWSMGLALDYNAKTQLTVGYGKSQSDLQGRGGWEAKIRGSSLPNSRS
jgi:hypothetical protein